ncbi:MAG: hypothetical protein EDS66_06520 [Planctomycetota bacterium]|nr:MAG: hypothetical protein EDS66_06520 [Planctomycetota bacterium]MCQ3921477.1 hypothetical protein [Planctomycetota bacterium]
MQRHRRTGTEFGPRRTSPPPGAGRLRTRAALKTTRRWYVRSLTPPPPEDRLTLLDQVNMLLLNIAGGVAQLV